jgi:hypothetical protein
MEKERRRIRIKRENENEKERKREERKREREREKMDTEEDISSYLDLPLLRLLPLLVLCSYSIHKLQHQFV